MDLEFPGVLKKQHMEIPGSQLKRKWDFQVMKKKSCGISVGLIPDNPKNRWLGSISYFSFMLL